MNNCECAPRDDTIQAILLCAGKGLRVGLPYNKVLHYAGTKTILELSLDKLLLSGIQRICLVIDKDNEAQIKALIGDYKNIQLCYGGQTRADSVRAGLKAITGCEIVVIHDGARPNVSVNSINNAIESAQKYGSGILAVPTADTIKVAENDILVKTLPRNNLYKIQTPQVFRCSEISKGYFLSDAAFLDDSEAYAAAGYSPRLVAGDYENIKITTAQDLYRISNANTRIGAGFDVHQLVANRKLILGGVEIPHPTGLLGHSDADVLTHAITDAILSAANLPDIGVLFPDTSEKYRGISSLTLLADVATRIKNSGYAISSISAVIMAQAPKLAPHISLMRETLAATLSISVEQINISATTTEHLGVIGEQRGMAASAVCLLSTQQSI